MDSQTLIVEKNVSITDRTKIWEQTFWVFIVLHVVCWTLLPTWMRLNLPMDSIEGTIWAQKLAWGYDKAPLLNGWLTTLTIQLFGYVDWGIYLTGQICVAICLITLWQLAKKMLPLVPAFFSVIVLEGFQYYNIGAIDFDDNVVQLPLWALVCLFFYKATFEENTWKNWVLLGVFAGLAMLAKYYAVLLLACVLIFLLLPENRYLFRKMGPYLALLAFISLLIPHVIWLFQNDFLTIRYVFRRIGDLPTWASHFMNPLLFLRDELYALAIPALLLSSLYSVERQKTWRLLRAHRQEERAAPLDRKRFLVCLGLGPFCLAVFISLIAGIKLHIMWGSALFSLWGILWMLFFPPSLDTKKIYRFFSVFLGLFLMTQGGYALSIHFAKNTSSAHFPGRTIADALTSVWHQNYQKPLSYVVGNRWLAGNAAFYSTDHPVVWVDGNTRLAAGFELDDLRRKGAIFIWDMHKEGEKAPKEYLDFFSDKKPIVHTKTFTWQTAPREKPIKLGMMFLSPFGAEPSLCWMPRKAAARKC